MKVIGIVGSPRENGNTEFFTQTALDELDKNGIETEFVSLIGKNISQCTG